MTARQTQRNRRWRNAIIVVAVCACVALFFLLQSNVQVEKRLVNRITTVMLPPPPPPPPETPPQPKKIDTPKDHPTESSKVEDQKPMDEALQAREGNSANDFGLQAGNGNGLHIGGGDHSAGFGVYARTLQREIQDALMRDKRTRKSKFHITLNLWLSPQGAIERSEVLTSDGDRVADAAVPQALEGITISELPPAGLPYPVRLRIGAQSNF